MSELYFKVLGPNGVCCHGGSGSWLIDGQWMPTVHGNLAPCVRGYHLCRTTDLVENLGSVIWIAEGREKSFISPKYLIFQEARVIRPLSSWTDETARLFAIECVERVLPILTAQFPNETRPQLALQAARNYINKTCDFAKLTEVATGAWRASRQSGGTCRDVMLAAYSAAVWENDGMAAWAATDAARTAAAAAAMEHSLAVSKENNLHFRDAERNANAASTAALIAEKEWQTKRLFEILGTIE